jgi:hypothetical protein
MTTKAPFKPDQVVVCIEAFAYGDGDVVKGARLRGDHPVVQKFAPYFIDDGSSDTQVVQQLWALHPDVEPRPDSRQSHLPKPLRDDDALLCLRSLFGVANVGQKVDRRNREVAKAARENPGSFVPVCNGVARADAVVATERMKSLNADGSVEYEIVPGLWYPRDHLAVLLSPSLFKLPEPAP